MAEYFGPKSVRPEADIYEQAKEKQPLYRIGFFRRVGRTLGSFFLRRKRDYIQRDLHYVIGNPEHLETLNREMVRTLGSAYEGLGPHVIKLLEGKHEYFTAHGKKLLSQAKELEGSEKTRYLRSGRVFLELGNKLAVNPSFAESAIRADIGDHLDPYARASSKFISGIASIRGSSTDYAMNTLLKNKVAASKVYRNVLLSHAPSRAFFDLLEKAHSQ
ncbi:MAG: hypothetical protein V1708_01845 [Candidatus Micrarchaeota archaeon]